LINLFRSRVDPLVRILHWPSFLEQYRSFRQRLDLQSDSSEDAQFPRTFYAGAESKAPLATLYSNLSGAAVPAQKSAFSAAVFDMSFGGLLFAVYYAALVSVIHDPNPPDLGCNIDPITLAATFKREVFTRVSALDNGAATPSMVLLQGMTISLVSTSVTSTFCVEQKLMNYRQAVEPESFDVQSQWLQVVATINRARELAVHRDGTLFGLSPVETELRRRVWSELCILDARYAEQLGREPTISSDSYDTMLPLSIDDRELAEIDAHEISSNHSKQDIGFKTHQEQEQEQVRQSPFSPMTFSLVRAESARLLTQLLAVRYHSRDAVTTRGGFDHGPRTRSRTSADKRYLISHIAQRFRRVYDLKNTESINPMRHLAGELAAITVEKATFITRVAEWKEDYSIMSERRKQIDTTKYVHPSKLTELEIVQDVC
jgi:hypothetical protein